MRLLRLGALNLSRYVSQNTVAKLGQSEARQMKAEVQTPILDGMLVSMLL
jgi:hypothetical protein